MSVSNQPQCWCSELCAMVWIIAEWNSVGFLPCLFPVCDARLLQWKPAGTTRYGFHMHVLTFTFSPSLPIIALGNVNVSPCLFPRFFFLSVFTCTHLWSTDVDICSGQLYDICYLSDCRKQIQSWWDLNRMPVSWVCVLAWPHSPYLKLF